MDENWQQMKTLEHWKWMKVVNKVTICLRTLLDFLMLDCTSSFTSKTSSCISNCSTDDIILDAFFHSSHSSKYSNKQIHLEQNKMKKIQYLTFVYI